jgi:hypothetical protein
VLSLCVQIVEISEGARREERIAYMANCPFDPAFAIDRQLHVIHSVTYNLSVSPTHSILCADRSSCFWSVAALGAKSACTSTMMQAG